MEYHLEAEVVPPSGTAELDALQRQGVVSLLDEQLELLAGIEGPDGMEIEPLDHQVGAHAGGASITWIVDAPALLFAEEAARHVLGELLERTDLLGEWTVARCEVTVSDDELATALAEPSDEAGAEPERAQPEDEEEDAEQLRAELLQSAGQLHAFGLDAFGHHDGDGAVSEEQAELAAGAIMQAVEVTTEELFQDVRILEDAEDAVGEESLVEQDDLWVLGELPERFTPHYTALFAKKFLVTTSVLGHRLAQPEWVPPLCTAEALALHVLKTRAMQQLQLDGLMDEETIKRAFAAFDEHAFEDRDHELLYEDSDLHGGGTTEAGAGGQRVTEWFHPFEHLAASLHPYLYVGDETEVLAESSTTDSEED